MRCSVMTELIVGINPQSEEVHVIGLIASEWLLASIGRSLVSAKLGFVGAIG